MVASQEPVAPMRTTSPSTAQSVSTTSPTAETISASSGTSSPQA